MGRLVLIDAISAVVLLGVWFFYFARYNRRKGAMALHWVEAACSSKGHMLDARWLSITQLQAHFGFSAHWFDNARVTIRLRPRPSPSSGSSASGTSRKKLLLLKLTWIALPASSSMCSVIAGLSQRHSQLTSAPRDWSVSQPGPGRSYHPQPLDPGTLPGGQHLDYRPRTQPDQRTFSFRIAPHCRHGSRWKRFPTSRPPLVS